MARTPRPVLPWYGFLAWLLAAAPALAQDAGSGSAEPSVAARLAALAFGLGAALSFVLFLALLFRGDALQVESHWGGFGGGLGGWRLSPSAAFLLVTLVLSGLAAMVIAPGNPDETSEKKNPATQQSGASGSGTQGTGGPAANPTPAPTPPGTAGR